MLLLAKSRTKHKFSPIFVKSRKEMQKKILSGIIVFAQIFNLFSIKANKNWAFRLRKKQIMENLL